MVMYKAFLLRIYPAVACAHAAGEPPEALTGYADAPQLQSAHGLQMADVERLRGLQGVYEMLH